MFIYSDINIVSRQSECALYVDYFIISCVKLHKLQILCISAVLTVFSQICQADHQYQCASNTVLLLHLLILISVYTCVHIDIKKMCARNAIAVDNCIE